MKIDEDALDEAIKAWIIAAANPMGLTVDDAIRSVIEAYEAAKWRPIEEAPRDVPVLVCLVDTRHEVYIATHGNDWRFDTYDDELTMTHQDLVDRNALFMDLPAPRQE